MKGILIQETIEERNITSLEPVSSGAAEGKVLSDKQTSLADTDEELKMVINKIKCLPKEDQLKIYQKCKMYNVPTKKNARNVEILVSDLTPEVLSFIKEIQERRISNTYKSTKSFKTCTYMRHEEIPNLIQTESDIDTNKNEKDTEIVEKKIILSNNQTFIKKRLKDCIKRIASCKKVHVEKSYGSGDTEGNDELGEPGDSIQDIGDDANLDGEDTGDTEGEIINIENDIRDDNSDTSVIDYNEIEDDNQSDSLEPSDNYEREESGSFFDNDFESILESENEIKLDLSKFSMHEKISFYRERLASTFTF